MSSSRLPPHPAQLINRSEPLVFRFANRRIPALAGDSIGSALHAAGLRILSRSFKYHRPRGLLCCAGRCASCLVNVDGVPNVRACTEPVRSGMQVTAQHAWPSLERDALAVFDNFDSILPVGFYHKTFIRPRRLWPAWEHVLKRLAGLGQIRFPDEPPGDYEREHLFADVAVVGGGAAGMAAALEAAAAGAHVVLVEAEPRLGGTLGERVRPIAEGELRGLTGAEVAARMASEIAADGRIRVLAAATAFGLYEDGLLGVLKGRCLVKLRARRTIVATGAFEHPEVFENNDLPGVMLGSGAQRLQALYGVRPGTRALTVSSTDRGMDVALDLIACGVGVAAVVDARPDVESAAAAELEAAGVPILRGHRILEARGRGRVSEAVVGVAGDRSSERGIPCDLVCVSSAVEPAAALIAQAGGRLEPDGPSGALVPAVLPDAVFAVGAVTGTEGLDAALASGRLAGAEAGRSLEADSPRLRTRVDELRAALATALCQPRRGDEECLGRTRLPITREGNGAPARPDRAPTGRGVPASARGRKRFVCLCEDVTAKDLAQAIAEGFDHIETLKRYTTVTMGPCQGKMCHRASIDLCASLTGRSVAETGTTTARPPVQPVPLGALAARSAEPVKLTPMHHRHVGLGAQLMDMGAWKRPLVYASVDVECRAVHEAVGVIDVSTLGKLELQGRDAGAFLDWLHPNRFTDLPPGRVRYRVMCDDAGIVLDDGVVARVAEDRYLVTTTTGGVEGVEQWFEWWLAGGNRCAHVRNLTGALGAINIAGPKARALLAPLTDVDLSPEAFPYLAAREGRVAGVRAVFLRIGFVGELGYELHFPADYGEHLWDTVLAAGVSLGVRPFGVEAQRVLRLEKQFAIVAHDTDALTNPLDANLGWVAKLDKPDFVGRDALRAARDRGSALRLVGFELSDGTTLPAEGAAVAQGGRPVGRVTSSKWSSYLGRAIGLAWLPAELARDGAAFEIRDEAGTRAARVVTTPFHDPEGLRLRS